MTGDDEHPARARAAWPGRSRGRGHGGPCSKQSQYVTISHSDSRIHNPTWTSATFSFGSNGYPPKPGSARCSRAAADDHEAERDDAAESRWSQVPRSESLGA